MNRETTKIFTSMVVSSWVLFTAATFLADVGRGFVKDDFSWVASARDGLTNPKQILVPSQAGFYRPLVTASFAVNFEFAELAPRAYGLTNLVLYALCAVGIAMLIRQLGLPWTSVLVGTFAWAINPHGIGMAVLWISGRTALLLTLTSVLSTLAFLRGYRFVGLTFFAAALLSKEEAVILPVDSCECAARRSRGE